MRTYRTWQQRQEKWEKAELLRVLKSAEYRAGGTTNVARLAFKLGLDRTTLYRMFRRHGIDPRER